MSKHKLEGRKAKERESIRNIEKKYGRVFGVDIKNTCLALWESIRPKDPKVIVGSNRETRVEDINTIINQDSSLTFSEEISVEMLFPNLELTPEISDKPFIAFICNWNKTVEAWLDTVEEQIENYLDNLNDEGIIFIVSSIDCCDINEVIRNYYDYTSGSRNGFYWDFYDDFNNGSFVLVKAKDKNKLKDLLDIVANQCANSPYPKMKRDSHLD